MALLSKTQILAANDLKTERVSVPEWGGEVIISTLPAAEKDDWDASVFDGEHRDLDNMRARLVVRCIVDEKGDRIFDDEDADALGLKSSAAMDRCFEVARRLNKVSDADLEALRKNSGSGQADS